MNLTFDEAKAPEISKRQDGPLVYLQYGVTLSHACLILLATLPNKADGCLAVQRHESHAERSVAHAHAVNTIIGLECQPLPEGIDDQLVISAPNNDLKLKPGLTANVTIFTLEKSDVLAVPSKALRFMPNEAFLPPEQKIEDCQGDTKLWTQEGNTFKAHKVSTGITNGVLTEILGGISEGAEVLTDFNMTGGNEAQGEQQASNPFMPKPRNNNKNNQQKKQ